MEKVKKENLIVRIYSFDQNGEIRVGTGYPIAPDRVITAQHVVEPAEDNQATKLELIWGELEDDEPKGFDRSQILRGDEIKIIYKGKTHFKNDDADIAILECKTPLTTHIALRRSNPNDNSRFVCRGYPKAGLDQEKKKHKALYFCGNTKGNDVGLEMQLTGDANFQLPEYSSGDTSEANAELKNEHSIWQGLSGSPVLIDGMLVAVVSSQYKTIGKTVFAISIPHLMKNCSEFQKAIGINTKHYLEYLDGQKKRLERHIDTLKQDKNALYIALQGEFGKGGDMSAEKLVNTLLKKMKEDAKDFFDEIYACCQDYELFNSSNEKMIRELLHLLLIQLTPKMPSTESNIYQWNVLTGIVTEFLLASRFKVAPKLARQEKVNNEVMGEFAITEETHLSESGWDKNATAKVNALSISGAVFKRVSGQDPANDEITKNDWENLNASLQTLRKSKINPKLYRLEVNLSKKPEHPLTEDDVCNCILDYLPDLPIIRHGEGQIDEESWIRSFLTNFFMELDQCHGV